MPARHWLAAIILILVALTLPGRAQSNAGVIRGTVTDQQGAIVQGATVRLANAITKYAQVGATDGQGRYQLIDVPFNSYLLAVDAPGFERAIRELVVRSNLVLNVDVKLGVKPVTETVNVNSVRGDLLNLDKTAPSVVIDKNRIENFPTSQPSRSTEQLIATAPGWTLDANNRLHARGIEYQVQYSIDGLPVTDTMASTFASAPDPRNFRSVEVT